MEILEDDVFTKKLLTKYILWISIVITNTLRRARMSTNNKVMRSLEELNAIDNFMFNELTMQEDRKKAEEFCRTVLEPIIERKINRLEIEPQKMMQGMDTDRHGIQMDAYITIDREEKVEVKVKFEKTIYDLEPGLYECESDEKRARFYHAVIDTHTFRKGEGYDRLSEVVVIMIMTYDPFGLGRMRYTVRRRCIEEPDMDYDDGDTTIFLYTRGKKGIPSRELEDMLHFLEDSSNKNATNDGLENIHKMMEDIKRNQRIGVKYMHTWDREYHIRNEGRKEGIAQGRVQLIKEALLKGRTVEELAQVLEIPEDEILEVQKDIINHTGEETEIIRQI